MISLPGYQTVAKLNEGASTRIYRLRREDDGATFILKVLKSDFPSAQEMARQRHEFLISKQLNCPGIVKAIELTQHLNRPAIIFEDFDGKALSTWLEEKPRLVLDEFFAIAIGLTEILGAIHAANVIHKNINPSNILFNESTGALRIIDFGLATAMSSESPVIYHPNELEGDLAYVSPEQTGRMNRLVDHRSDYYSLGIVFYRLLCQRLPFVSADPLEAVHAHIAKRPVEPIELVPGLSAIVSKLVTKLLAKNAEDRYQSAWGLKWDLENCQTQWRRFAHIADFELAERDRSDRFRLFQKLYGREEELETLLGAFDRVSQSARELLLVAGYSGIGKTSLVQEVYKPITARRGFFISGKFEQFQRNNPYSAVVSALRSLVRQILAESNEQIADWKKRLLKALGPNGRIIIDVIPEVESIVGPQPPVPSLGPVEAQNRFELVFKDFIRIFCRHDHPLAMFLDDLQWADSASLKLMHLMMTDDRTNHLLLIGAYRDNEVGKAHPLQRTIEEMKKDGARISALGLLALKLEHVNELVADSLYAGMERSTPMAQLLIEKTGGNPFFIGMFLKSLHSEKLLVFDQDTLEWQWDLDRIKAVGMTDNVGELLSGRIRRAGADTQTVLQLAACIGNRFSLRDLALVAEKDPREIARTLQQAVEEGLITPFDDSYKLLVLEDAELEQMPDVAYRFAHDRIQRVAYALAKEPERQATHRQIGQHLLANTPEGRLDERIFDIVNQLNVAIGLIDTQEARDHFSELNLRAGRKAKASAAFGVAYDYMQTGIELLGKSPWARDYELAISLYVEAAEAAYLSGQFSQTRALARIVEREARTLLDKVKVYEVEIAALKAQYLMKDAVVLALKVLKLLSVKLPGNPTLLDLARGQMSTVVAMVGKKVERLPELPEMKDLNKLAAMRVITTLSSAAFFVKPMLLPPAVFKAVTFSIRYGNAPDSASLYAAYGLVLCVLRDIDLGYRFGNMALKLQEQSQAKEHEAKTQALANGMVFHWKRHLRTTLAPLRDAFQIGLETGDHEYAGFSAFFYCTHSLLCGLELAAVAQEYATYRDAVGKLKQATSIHMYCIYQQVAANLQGRAPDPSQLTGEFFDEAASFPLIKEANDFTTLYLLYCAKLIVAYLFQDFQKAVKYSESTEEYLDGAGAIVHVPIFKFYSSLALLSLYFRSSPEEQRQIMRKVLANQKDMRTIARFAPMNHLHRYHLVEAERLRAMGQKARAREQFDKAIALAKEHEYINDEALANELAARFYLANDEIDLARKRLVEALLCYRRWGAEAKADQLERRYWTILHPEQATSTGTSGRTLDLAAIMQAAQAISEEIVLSRLLDRLMNLVVQNAGAQRAYLLMETDGKLYIEAEKTEQDEEVKVLVGEPYQDSKKLATSIVNWVIRTGEDVVVPNAALDERFSKVHDPYLQSQRPKSVLCMRIMRKAKLSAILYLENNLAADAFTEQGMAMLAYLTSQIAISLENARLFSNLEQSELRFRELYDNIADGVSLVDRNDRILVANPSFYHIIEVPRREAGELTFRRWIHQDDLAAVDEKVFGTLLRGKEVRDASFRLVSKHDNVCDVECNARVVRKEEGKVEFQMVLRDVTERKRLQDKLIQSLKDVQNARSGLILGLAKLAEYRDTDTGAHLERIREFAKLLAVKLSVKPKYRGHITEEYVDDIYFSSVLHDIGKVGIPDKILLKPGLLTREERSVIEKHPTIGGQVLRTVEARVGHQSFLRIGMQIAYGHHEKWDGSGYPEGVKGEAIPLAARIVALADVYDAITSKRVYKPARSHQEAKELLAKDSGKHFDPEVVEAFLELEKDFDAIRHEMHAEAEKPLLEQLLDEYEQLLFKEHEERRSASRPHSLRLKQLSLKKCMMNARLRGTRSGATSRKCLATRGYPRG